MLDRAAATDPDQGRALLLCGHALLSGVGALTEAAFAVCNEDSSGIVVEGPPEVAFLRDGGAEPAPTQVVGAAESVPAADRPLRRVARIASWTPWHRLPRAIAAPWATAVTHNPLLRSTASGNGHAIGFRHGDGWLASIRSELAAASESRPMGDDIASLLAKVGLPPVIEERLAKLIARRAAPMLRVAQADLQALKKAPLPQRLWSGSGGYYAARALGLEVLRRGGEVVRFDHGGSTAPIEDPGGLALIELSVSSELVLPTDELTRYAHSQVLPGFNCAIRGGRGDTTFRSRARRNAPTQRPKVVYAPTVVRGFRKASPPNIADQVYLDWQADVAQALATLPVDLILRPHPEGLFRGRPHPLAAIAPLSPHPFETLLAEADVLVFDCAASTTFWEAVCSDRKVIYLDLGTARFVPGLAETLRRRLRIVDVRFDANRRPIADRDVLADAITQPAGSGSDELRQLFAGHA